MSSAFPNMIPNEPPPLDFGDDEDDETGEEDYPEFTSRGLRLDILGEPSPQSSPQRKVPVVPPVAAAIPDKDKMCSKDKLSPTAPENHYATINGTSGHNPDADGHKNEQNREKISDENVKAMTSEPYSNNQTIDNDCSPSPAVPSEESSYEEQQDDFGDFSNVLPSSHEPVSSISPSVELDDDELRDFSTEVRVQEDLTGHVELSQSNLLDDGSQDFSSQTNVVQEPISRLFPQTDDLEDDDDFGEFSSEVRVQEELAGHLVLSQPNLSDNDFQDLSSEKNVVQEPISKLCTQTDEFEDDDFGDFSSEVHVQEKLTEHFILSQSNLLDDDFQHFSNVTNVVQVQQPISSLCPQTDDFEDDDDFGDFCSNANVTPRTSVFEPPAVTSLPPLPLRTTLIGSSSSNDMEFEEIPIPPVPTRVNRLEKIHSTDFPLVAHSTPPPTTSSSNVAADPAFAEDFGDFLSSEQSAQAQVPVKFTRKDSQIETRFDSLVSSVFDQPSTIPANNLNMNSLRHIDKELEGKANLAWTHIQDFEDSHGLKFKWLNSIAHRHLLSSLKVDSSTILYSGRWGAIEVPKFAAHLADIPLQPLQPESSSASVKPSSSSSSSDFQEFQSHKPVTNTNNSDENHRSSTQNTIKETKIGEGTLTQISDLSCTKTTRTAELVFPSTPMFNN